MSGALALRTGDDGREERVVTVCCGGHHPAPGEASTCACCAECVTSADVQARPPAARAAEARDRRAWLAIRRRNTRRTVYVLEHGAIEDQVRGLVEAFGHAVRHAVALPPRQERPELPELDDACLRHELLDTLHFGFTGTVPT
ncbi:hypothetical protein AB0425_17860 [Actinosynnema sp. NPDC051121]